MVHEQGEVVDSIEGNVETAAVAVTEGADQLRQAEIYKVRKVPCRSFNYACFILLPFSFFNL